MEIRSYPRQPKEASGIKPLEETPRIAAPAPAPSRSGRERVMRRRKIRKETKAKLLLMRTLALGSVAAVALGVFVVIGILRTKEDSGQGWKNPDAVQYQAYSGAKKMREFPAPSSGEIVSQVRKVLGMRNAGEFRDLVRLKGITEAEAVDFLTHLNEREGKVTGVTWQSVENVNNLQLEGAVLEFEKGRPRLAYLTPDETGVWQVDLAALAGRCSVPWDEFYSGPDRAAELRAVAARDTYYNGRYTDDHAWAAYLLSYGGSDHVLTGYCPKDGPADLALKRILKLKSNAPVVVQISKTGGPGQRQVEILSVLAEGWVLTDTPFDGGSHSEAPPEEK